MNAWDKVSSIAIKKCWTTLMSTNEQWRDEDDQSLKTIYENMLQEQALLLIPSIPTLLRDILLM